MRTLDPSGPSPTACSKGMVRLVERGSAYADMREQNDHAHYQINTKTNWLKDEYIAPPLLECCQAFTYHRSGCPAWSPMQFVESEPKRPTFAALRQPKRTWTSGQHKAHQRAIWRRWQAFAEVWSLVGLAAIGDLFGGGRRGASKQNKQPAVRTDWFGETI